MSAKPGDHGCLCRWPWYTKEAEREPPVILSFLVIVLLFLWTLIFCCVFHVFSFRSCHKININMQQESVLSGSLTHVANLSIHKKITSIHVYSHGHVPTCKVPYPTTRNVSIHPTYTYCIGVAWRALSAARSRSWSDMTWNQGRWGSNLWPHGEIHDKTHRDGVVLGLL